MSDSKQSNDEGAMHRRRITLEDGRYLIFYSFDEPKTPPPVDAPTSLHQPDAVPVAEEEPRV